MFYINLLPANENRLIQLQRWNIYVASFNFIKIIQICYKTYYSIITLLLQTQMAKN